jgi:hypothetical protein
MLDELAPPLPRHARPNTTVTTGTSTAIAVSKPSPLLRRPRVTGRFCTALAEATPLAVVKRKRSDDTLVEDPPRRPFGNPLPILDGEPELEELESRQPTVESDVIDLLSPSPKRQRTEERVVKREESPEIIWLPEIRT